MLIPITTILVSVPESLMEHAESYKCAELFFGALAHAGYPEFAREWWAALPEKEQLGVMTRQIHRQLLNGKALELTYGAAALEANGVDVYL